MTTNTLWEAVGDYYQQKMIEAYASTQDDACTPEVAREYLASLDDETLRDHLKEGIGYTNEDEHDRLVDMRYDNFTREYEAANDASFQDMAHALVLAQDCIVDRIERIEALHSADHQFNVNRDAILARLKMSHSRISELLLAHYDDEAGDNFVDGDGWVTRCIDVWIRG
jgi:hypothetical protein